MSEKYTSKLENELTETGEMLNDWRNVKRLNVIDYEILAKKVINGELTLSQIEIILSMEAKINPNDAKFFWNAYKCMLKHRRCIPTYQRCMSATEFVDIRICSKNRVALETMKQNKDDTIDNVIESLQNSHNTEIFEFLDYENLAHEVISGKETLQNAELKLNSTMNNPVGTKLFWYVHRRYVVAPDFKSVKIHLENERSLKLLRKKCALKLKEMCNPKKHSDEHVRKLKGRYGEHAVNLGECDTIDRVITRLLAII